MPEGLRPKTPDELKDLIAGAAAEEARLETVGQGTKRGVGRPVEAERVVHLDGLATWRKFDLRPLRPAYLPALRIPDRPPLLDTCPRTRP